MAKLEILVYPDARLKQVSSPVEKFDEELFSFIADLEETMRASPGCTGIAAPQVGRFERVIIIDASGKPKIRQHGRQVLINPDLTEPAGEVVGREGCLSVPDYTGNVARAERIAVSALDENGNKKTFRMEGFEARLVQHEVDHLNGLLYLDRLVSRRNSLFPRKKK